MNSRDLLRSLPLRRPFAHVLAAASIALLLTACGGGKDSGGAAAGAASGAGGGGGKPAGGAPPPPKVGVVTVQPQAVSLQTELPGRVDPLRVAQVRARVNGVVLKRQFREGSEVKAGQVLYQIDPAPYRASFESARATLARAEANVAQARAQAERYKPLVEANAISKQEYVNAVAAQKTAEADVAAGKASVETARINLSYATVTAPISGRIGRALVTEGALVSATEATQLATVQQIDRVYVNFTQSASELLRLRRSFDAGQLRKADADAAEVRVVLDDGSELPQPGKLLFSDLTVDATSGQVTLRAEVPNVNNLLLPGQYVRVRLSQAQLPSGLMVPQQAVTRSDQGDSLTVIGPDNKPARRQVKVGPAEHNQWVVFEGLQPGERVMVDGFQKLMMAPPGSPVQPVPWQPPSARPPASAASGAASSPSPAASSASSGS